MEMILKVKEIIEELLKEISPRQKEVIFRRFGFKKNGKKESLESIGKDWGITRERVRQIEKRAIDIIKKSQKFSLLKEPVQEIKNFIDGNGGLKREDLLIENLSPEPQYRPCLIFILKIEEPFFYRNEDSSFYSLWGTKKEALPLAQKVNDLLIKTFLKEKRLLKKEEFLERGRFELKKELNISLPELYLLSFVEISKKIEENIFGEFGLTEWPEVVPSNVGDKAYMVMKKEKKPFHFIELAKKLSEVFSEEIRENTLHNELIKNEKFVLIGRGIYALKEWGYKEGTVREVIFQILKEEGPLSKEEILKKVKEQRLIKDATIFLSLRNFKKNEKGKYIISNG